MGRKGTSKLNIGRIDVLHSIGYNDKKIAEHIKASHTSVSYIRRNILKYDTILETLKLSKNQEEILVGTLLGDSYLGYTHSGCNYPCLTFSHCEDQEIYARHKFKKLQPLMSSITKRQYHTKTIINNVECNVQPVLYARSKNCKVFIKYREIFYPDGVKIIPIDFLYNTFTEHSLAYLFMDDGNRNGKTYNLNLQCFELDNLKEFVKFLKIRFNLDFNIKKDKTLYLRQHSVERFKRIIIPYITKDMQYKLVKSHR